MVYFPKSAFDQPKQGLLNKQSCCKNNHKGHKMCFVAIVNFLVTSVVEKQMQGFMMVLNRVCLKSLKCSKYGIFW